jgi:hypothetical protein
MCRFYRTLPSELLDLPIDDFRMALQVFRMHVMEEDRQLRQAQAEANARTSSG